MGETTLDSDCYLFPVAHSKSTLLFLKPVKCCSSRSDTHQSRTRCRFRTDANLHEVSYRYRNTSCSRLYICKSAVDERQRRYT